MLDKITGIFKCIAYVTKGDSGFSINELFCEECVIANPLGDMMTDDYFTECFIENSEDIVKEVLEDRYTEGSLFSVLISFKVDSFSTWTDCGLEYDYEVDLVDSTINHPSSFKELRSWYDMYLSSETGKVRKYYPKVKLTNSPRLSIKVMAGLQ